MHLTFWIVPYIAVGLIHSELQIPHPTPAVLYTFPSWVYRQDDSIKNHLVMSMCKAMSCVIDKGSLVWPVPSLGRIQLIFLSCFILYSKAKLACYSSHLLTFSFCIPIHYDDKNIFHLQLALGNHVCLHRTDQCELLHNQDSGQRLALLWWWIVCLENEQRPFCKF